jgi:N-acylneuraminate cytidylyltransferase
MGTVTNEKNEFLVAAIVPAKMTSIRLPRKNLADLGGYPLFYYSVRAAQLCPNVNEVFVSSESAEVLEAANKYGAHCISRPAELSLPNVTNADVLHHALQEMTNKMGKEPDLTVLLQPTHPLRIPSDITKGIYAMLNDDTADCLFSLVKIDELRGVIQDSRFIPEYPLPRNKQFETKRYRNTGSFYIFRTARTIRLGKLFTSEIIPLVLSNPQFEIDVDEASDLELARSLLEANKMRFSMYAEING